jgi:hypothetical protein
VLRATTTESLSEVTGFLGSQEVSREPRGRGFSRGSWGHMVAAWSMCCERRVVNCEVRVSRSSVEAADDGVLSMVAWSEAVWLMRSCVLALYSLMCRCERGALKLHLRVECGLREGLSSEGVRAIRKEAGLTRWRADWYVKCEGVGKT